MDFWKCYFFYFFITSNIVNVSTWPHSILFSEITTGRRDTMKKKLSKGWAIGIILFTLLTPAFSIVLGTMLIESSPQQTEEQTTENKYQYQTSIKLADVHYACSVGISDYNGDIIEPGTYKIYPTGVITSGNYIPTVWDLYVSENYYNNISELSDQEYIGSVGGLDQLNMTYEFPSGKYLYVKYHKVANDKPTGILMIEKEK